MFLDNSSDCNKLEGAIEAILFLYGEPLEVSKIIKILEQDQSIKKILQDFDLLNVLTMRQFLEQLNKKYINSGGLKLIFSDTSVQLVTKPEFVTILEDFVKEEFKENLTPAALETIALIAYLGPLSRSEIDYYRGVNSAFTLRSLLLRGLVDRFSAPGRDNVFLYKVSFDCLKYLGISRVDELPEYEKFRALIEKTENISNGDRLE
jgi:segregation and condensation protein B